MICIIKGTIEKRCQLCSLTSTYVVPPYYTGQATIMNVDLVLWSYENCSTGLF